MKKNLRYCLGIFLLSTVGCGYRQDVISRRSFPLLSTEERARIHDLSFPLHSELEKLLSTEKELVISYLTDLSQDALSEHYHTSMEYWGWEELSRIHAAESCFIFSKPSKICAVTVRPEARQMRVLIFVASKK